MMTIKRKTPKPSKLWINLSDKQQETVKGGAAKGRKQKETVKGVAARGGNQIVILPPGIGGCWW